MLLALSHHQYMHIIKNKTVSKKALLTTSITGYILLYIYVVSDLWGD